MIVSILTIIPLLYFLYIRKKVLGISRLVIGLLAISLFLGSYMLIYLGIPTMTKIFIENQRGSNMINLNNSGNVNFSIELTTEMFKRVGVHAKVSKAEDIKISDIQVQVLSNTAKIIAPVFDPIAWDSIHYETIKMNSFFELNDHTRLNRFSIWAQYPIDDLDSIEMNVKYTFTQAEESIEMKSNYKFGIKNDFVFEKLINYE